MQKLVVLWAVLVGACEAAVAIDDPVEVDMPTEEDVEQPVGPTEGMETQGRYLLGEALDVLGLDPEYHASVGPQVFDARGGLATLRFDGEASILAIDSQQRVHRANDLWFLNVRMPIAGGGGELKIVGVRVEGAMSVYKLRHRATAADPWTDPCAGSEAVPLAGRWSRKGVHETDATVTFACLGDGVAGKCTKWGYRAAGIAGSDIWLANQACTRMARNDMCGNGTSMTHEGTAIVIYDYVGVKPWPPDRFQGVDTWPPPASNFYYESAWTKDGPKCGTKLRWSQMALGGPCPATLHDPRLDPSISFCLDEPPLEAGVYLLNESRYNALALRFWERGGDRVSTVRGYYGGGEIVEPFDDTTGFEFSGYDAMLLRAPPDSVLPSDIKEVHLYVGPGGGDHVISDVRPADYTDRGVEGFVFTWQLGANMVPFRLYRRDGTTELFSKTGLQPPGYTFVRDIGWLTPL